MSPQAFQIPGSMGSMCVIKTFQHIKNVQDEMMEQNIHTSENVTKHYGIYWNQKVSSQKITNTKNRKGNDQF